MHLKLLCPVIFFVLISCSKSNDDPKGPETNCHLNDLYVQDGHRIYGAIVYDIRTGQPKEIDNTVLESSLNSQWNFLYNGKPIPIPYSEYFIDSIDFISPSEVEIHIYKSVDSRIYTYTRNDCGLDLHSPEGDLHFELTHSGDEVTEQRFAIFNHMSRWVTYNSSTFKVDTFSFLEFRLGAFASTNDIIQQFAHDHPGEYDTVAVELVQNKTRE